MASSATAASRTPASAVGRASAAAAPLVARRAGRVPAAATTTLGRFDRSRRRHRRSAIAASPSSADVVCVGEALFDLIADQKGVPREQVSTWTAYPGGAPCNVATAAARLGAKAAFVSALGSDAGGDELAALLRERGVDVSGVQRCPPDGPPTRSVYVVRTADGDREFSGFGGPTETYSDCFLDAEKLDVAALKGARAVVTGTLGLAYPASRRAIVRAAEAAREAGAVVLVDVNWRPVFWPELMQKEGGMEEEGSESSSSSSSSSSSESESDSDDDNKGSSSPRRVILDFLAKYADIVKVSDADLEYLCEGVTCEAALSDPCALLGGGGGGEGKAASALPLPTAAGVLVTAGEKGAAYCFRAPNKGAHSGFVPAYDVGVADTTGAGDAFTAGFLWWMLCRAGGSGGGGEGSSGRDALRALQSDPSALADAVAFGAATGALTCTRPGAIASQPGLAEVMALFEQGRRAGAPAA
jgi:fructokinase